MGSRRQSRWTEAVESASSMASAWRVHRPRFDRFWARYRVLLHRRAPGHSRQLSQRSAVITTSGLRPRARSRPMCGRCSSPPARWPPFALVILFDAAFPRQRSKAPGEQRFAAVVSDGDHLLQPEPLVCLTEQLRNHRHRWPQHSLPSGRYSLTWAGLAPAGSRQLCLAPSTYSITSSARQ